MSGARHRQKGDRIEREIVDRHKALSPRAGAHVFVAKPESKRPLVEWRDESIADADLVKEWFKQWPNALLAIDAVDMAYSAAQWAGLPETVGDDAIQLVLSGSFANARRL